MYVAPTRTYGCTRLCVRENGAVGDGVHDDTAAFQATINALPASGGTVHVPAGTYLIDPTVSVKLRSNMLLQMDAGVTLQAKTNALPRAYVLSVQGVNNVEIAGGAVVGDRDTHNYVDTGNSTRTHEWGHAISVGGARAITIRDMDLSKCTGDGISVGGKVGSPTKDLVVVNVRAHENRRQGLSLVNVDGCVVYNCDFYNTHGTSPECGIDVEPEYNMVCNNVLILGNRCYGNNKYGINIIQRVGAGIITNVTLDGNEVHDNASNGVVTFGGKTLKVVNNYIHNNSATGLFMTDSVIVVQNNTFEANYTRLGIKTRTPFIMSGWASKIERDILMRGVVTYMSILSNNYK